MNIGKHLRSKVWLAISLPVLILILFVFVAFLKSRYLPETTAAALRFHDQLQQGQIEQIYSDASPAFKASLPKESAVRILEQIHGKMGHCAYSGPMNWFVSTNSRGTFVTTRYRANCSNGEAA